MQRRRKNAAGKQDGGTFFLKKKFCRLTFLQNLLDLDVVRTEAAVELEVVGVVKKRSAQ